MEGNGCAALEAPAACTASPDHADIMATIEDAASDWKKQGYETALAEVRDMAAVGRDLMERIAEAKYAGSPIEHWAPADSPVEIVFDLLNMLIEAPAAGWQPIETAPKDGTRVLVWTETFGGRPTTARWSDDRYARKPKPRWISDEKVYGRAAFIENQPTHWMPLPEAPRGAE